MWLRPGCAGPHVPRVRPDRQDREAWWKSAVHGAREIDTTKVDSTRDMYDYDPETQGAIRKIMFDQHQVGRGTSMCMCTCNP